MSPYFEGIQSYTEFYLALGDPRKTTTSTTAVCFLTTMLISKSEVSGNISVSHGTNEPRRRPEIVSDRSTISGWTLLGLGFQSRAFSWVYRGGETDQCTC